MAKATADYVCTYCGRSFARKYDILNHIKNIHVGTACVCVVCKRKFRSPVGLQLHLSRGHNRFDQGNPECDICGKIFTRRENIIFHLETTHSFGNKKKENTCELCNKKFTNGKNLKAHIRKLHMSNTEQPACDECNKVFRVKEALLAHIRDVHKVSVKDIHRCHLCEKVYSSQKNLKRHLIAFHCVVEEHKCSVCSKSFDTNSDMRRHVKEAHGIDLPKEFACEHCSKVFSERSYLESHVSLHHRHDSLKPWKHVCECGKEFNSERSLRRHIKSDHDFDVFYSYCKNSLLRTVPLGAEKTHSKSEYDCEVCQEHFASLYDLRNHMKANHDLQLSMETCNVCFLKFYSKEAMNQHEKACVAPRNTIQCSGCDKLFTAKSSLNLHMKIFHPKPEKPPSPAFGDDLSQSLKKVNEEQYEMKCKYCDKAFKTKFNVQQHIECVHLGLQKFRCLDCESYFKERRNLRKHIRIKHPDSSTFPQCHFCYKRFESAKICSTHLRQAHSFDAKNFPCEICSASFSTNESLTLHMRTKHADEEELFKCENCSILFKGYETFERHSQQCQGHSASAPEFVPRCVICIKDFCTEKSLKRHIKIFHEGLNPDELAEIGFSKRSFAVDCKDCLEKFADEELYQVYLKMKDITEAIVFKCPTCGDTYNAIEFAVQRYKKTMKVRKRKSSLEGGGKDRQKSRAVLEKSGCKSKHK